MSFKYFNPIIFIVILFINFNSSCEAKETKFKHELAICAMYNDDDLPYLNEWVEFHKLQGVGYFYMYNNGSKKNWKNPPKNVQITHLPTVHHDQVSFVKLQGEIYSHCIKKVKNHVKWLAIIDTDEFLFSPEEGTLPEVLKAYEEYAGVVVNWMIYGTSHVKSIPLGEKLTDHLLFRAPLDYGSNLYVKSIVNPRLVKECTNPHFLYYQEGYFAVTENFFPHLTGNTLTHSSNRLRINHYWVRDETFLHETKIPRVNKWTGRDCKEELVEVNNTVLNSVYDDSIVHKNK